MEDPIGDNLFWDPTGGSLFVHSHLYDPVGVAPGDGDDELLGEGTEETVRLFSRLEGAQGFVPDLDALVKARPRELTELARRLKTTD